MAKPIDLSALKKPVVDPAPEPVKDVAPQQELVKTPSFPPETAAPLRIMSEMDSYLADRMKAQPASLDDVAKVTALDDAQAKRHRLSLPSYFETLAYQSPKDPGPYVFRWLFKAKQAIDHALNVTGWLLVNRTYFPDAPKWLFSANGGVEVGDAILAFMPTKQALTIRNRPSEVSRERLAAQVTNVDKDYALMTGNPQDPKVYKPEMGPEASEATEGKTAGVLTEGRDF